MAQLLSAIVPCYNEELVLPLFYREFVQVMSGIPDMDYELILVDDGSSDRTLEVIKELSSNNPKVKYVSFSRNFGKEAAIYAGLQHGKGDYFTLMDADLQDPPSLLPEMLEAIREGYDHIATRRSTREGEPAIRSFFARSFYRLINRISDTEIVDGARDFRLMKKEVVDAILELPENNRFSKGIFEWVGFRTKWISYTNVERIAGETKWSFWKLFKYAIDGIIGFSTVPLAAASFTGLFCFVLAVIAMIVILVKTLIWGDPVEGWPALACFILFFSGIQLLSVGIVGQYLAKTYLETKRRPMYIKKESNMERNS